MKKVDFEITKHIGTIREGNYPVMANFIRWGGMPPVFDLRRWRVDENGQKFPLKGLTLSMDELKTLKRILNEIEVAED